MAPGPSLAIACCSRTDLSGAGVGVGGGEAEGVAAPAGEPEGVAAPVGEVVAGGAVAGGVVGAAAACVLVGLALADPVGVAVGVAVGAEAASGESCIWLRTLRKRS